MFGQILKLPLLPGDLQLHPLGEESFPDVASFPEPLELQGYMPEEQIWQLRGFEVLLKSVDQQWQLW
jgi:hypothetical protein